MAELSVTQIGNSLGVILPKEVLAQLHVEKGDKLYITETTDGIELRAHDPLFAKKMDILEQIMREDKDVLKKLAE